MLWLCIFLPRLPLEAFGAAYDQAQACVVSEGVTVLLANPAAESLGVQAGMRVTAAQALGNIAVIKRQLPREQAALMGLAVWSGQFTSSVSLEPPHALLLEIGASLRLFGGAEALRDRIAKELQALGYFAVLSAAPTPRAALYLARVAREVIVQAPAEIPQALATLPPAVLNIDARTVALLGRLGVRDLRTCWQLPRAALTRRFGKRLREELDWALGLHPEVRIVFESPPRFDRQCELIAETDNTQALQFVARRLILELAGFLRARHAGTHVLQWTLCHADKKRTGLQLGLVSPSCDPERFSSLLRERLERLRLRMPVRALRLQVDDVVPLLAKTDDLFASGTAELQENSDRLLERLRARLGMNAVQGLSLVPEHRPEYAWRYCEPGQGKAEMQMPPRPLWLLAEPVPLRIGKVTWQRDVSLLAGERIQSGWWDGRQIVRDYFVLHDRQGLRLWVFREPGNADTWYVHGVFA